jgi:hypothetical protein
MYGKGLFGIKLYGGCYLKPTYELSTCRLDSSLTRQYVHPVEQPGYVKVKKDTIDVFFSFCEAFFGWKYLSRGD